MNEKKMYAEFEQLKKAMKELKGFFSDEDEDDEMNPEEICTELAALADGLEQIESKAEKLTEKALSFDLDTDVFARICYANAFMIKMNASAQSHQLRFTVDFIRKQSQRDEL